MQKRGLPALQGKNKDQVRFFYYRTWHKIAKHISFSGSKYFLHFNIDMKIIYPAFILIFALEYKKM